MPDVITITVSLSDSGDLHCSKPSAVKKSDTVKWKSPQGLAFSVDFGWDTPFHKEQYRTGAIPGGTAIEADIEKASADKHGRRMKFKYTIAALGNDGQIVIEDPEIIIDP